MVLRNGKGTYAFYNCTGKANETKNNLAAKG